MDWEKQQAGGTGKAPHNCADLEWIPWRPRLTACLYYEKHWSFPEWFNVREPGSFLRAKRDICAKREKQG